MEENKRFRNHISIILEQAGSGIWVILGILLWQVIDDPELIGDLGAATGDRMILFFILGGIFLLVLLILGIQLWIWSKTYISIEGNTIVFEKNTLKRQKKTIGIRNISNINTEQNLFEMLVGTCKVKMDTDSFSTADATDLKIVLKKKDAEAFRDYILHKMNHQAEEEIPSGRKEENQGAGIEEMLLHGFYSIRILSVLAALFCMGGFLGLIRDLLTGGMEGFGMLSTILILGLFSCSIIWSIVKEFLQYYGFYAERKGERLHIQYGLLKKVDYTIPISKINAVRLIQTPHARLMKRYTAELINVGMGDNEEEEQSFFLMYDRQEKIREEIRRLLPEFSECLEGKTNRQPSSVWKIWAVSELFLIAVLGVIYAIAAEFFVKYLTIAAVVLMAILLLSIVIRIFAYRTEGTVMGEEMLGICQGAFGRETIFVKFEKIQYMEVKQSVIAKKLGIAKAKIHLLAASAKSLYEVPYFPEEMTEPLKERLLGR